MNCPDCGRINGKDYLRCPACDKWFLRVEDLREKFDTVDLALEGMKHLFAEEYTRRLAIERELREVKERLGWADRAILNADPEAIAEYRINYMTTPTPEGETE